MTSKWNAKQYLRFEAERTQPAIDLANRILLDHPAKIVDIGCGPGNSTMVLRQRYPNADILGIDSSEAMVRAAASAYPDIKFALCDAGRDLSSLGTGFDVVFSNACIQWIPNHPKLLGDMFSLLGQNGVLAVQLPVNKEEPLLRTVMETVSQPKWNFSAVAKEVNEVLPPQEYFDILSALTSNFQMWETTYFHRMTSHQALLDWAKSTRLRPYLAALDEEGQRQLEKEILDKFTPLYPQQRNGEFILRFRRLFFLAIKE